MTKNSKTAVRAIISSLEEHMATLDRVMHAEDVEDGKAPRELEDARTSISDAVDYLEEAHGA